ncbi:MAG: MFS transporter [Acidimicrobiia bacterium]|nr:MFS transporter [Acidimicrobiia bacterium]
MATLAASLIWGINTLFLLDAGLNNTEAFAANAFYTAGQVVFEVPTGVIADTWGRRASYLLGSATLLVSTLLYLYMWSVEAPLWGWAIASIFIGLGFTFFTGAVEAWLVDALAAAEFEGNLDDIFAGGQTITGVAMLSGSVAGGFIAQATNLGVPFILRAVILGMVLIAAWFLMHDEGFTPSRGKGPIVEVKRVLKASLDNGLRNRPMRWLMLASPFTMGVGIYAFYAMQPYLLELYGDPNAFAVAGIAAAVIAGAQIVGGLLAPFIRRIVKRRTDALIFSGVMSVVMLIVIGITSSFWVAVIALVVWSVVGSTGRPLRQAYVNGLIDSEQRATVLSFDALMGSAGGVVTQPALGRAADVWGYSASYVVSGVIAAFAVPFIGLSRSENAPADIAEDRAAV